MTFNILAERKSLLITYLVCNVKNVTVETTYTALPLRLMKDTIQQLSV